MRVLRKHRIPIPILALAATALLAGPTCRRKPVEIPPSHDSALSEISRPIPSIPEPHLSSRTPDTHGLVASILTPRDSATKPREPLDWVPLLPTPGKIVWIQDMSRGYEEAVRLNKPMVVVFGTGGPMHQKVLQSFEDPHLLALADQALFIQADPTKEIVAKNICTALGVEHLPLIAVLRPDPEIISEEIMVEGFEEPERLARDLTVPLLRANGKLPPVPTMAPR